MTKPKDRGWMGKRSAQQRERYRDCECSDPGCRKGHGAGGCTNKGTRRVGRCDMTPDGSAETFVMCPTCAKDALDSGVFS